MKKFSKILLYDFSRDEELISKLEEYTDNIQLIQASDDYQDVLKKEDFVGVDCFVVNVFDNFHDEFFHEGELKVVFTMFTDNSMFNLELLQEQGIKIYNITGQAAQGVCEFAVSVILEKIKMTSQTQQFSKDGKTGFQGFKGTEIFEKQVGVIGYGSLGKHFSQIMKGFGAGVKYFSRSSNDTSLESIFSDSDIIFVSHPLSDGNSEYGKGLLNQCKQKAFILNPSRIECFNISDLYDFLVERTDCIFWQDESVTEEWSKWKEKFLTLDNFILTPHCGFFTSENPTRVKKLTLKNIENYES